LLRRDLLHAPVIQDQQVGLQQLIHQPCVAAIAVGDAQLFEQARHAQVANREPLDDSALKVAFLAIQQASKKWTMPIHDWGRH